MRERSEKSTKSGKIRKGVWAAVIAVAVVVVGVVFSLLYNTVASSIVNLSIDSMEELTQHDKQTITRAIETQWDTLTNLGESLRNRRISTRSALMDELNNGSITDSIDFGLVDSEGNIYTNKRVEDQDGIIAAMCAAVGNDASTGKFVNIYFNAKTIPDHKGEIIIFGVQLKAFTVGDIRMEYIFCRMGTNKLENKLKIDSYDGKGYSSIFNREGYYLVRYQRSEDVNAQENFYNDLSEYKLQKGIDEAYIRARIAEGEIFTIEATVNGEARLLRFSPVEDMDFYFVLNVSRSVFENQSRKITVTILLYFIAMAAVAVAAIILLFYGRSSAKEAKLEKRHKQELSEALLKAEDASIAKTSFLNNMSHDIRTPMNAIIGFTDLAVKYVGDEERTLDYLTKISNSSKHLLRLINDVLDMSRIESGKTHWELVPEDIGGVASNIVNMVSGEAADHGLSFETKIEIEHNFVRCDKLRLTQVMLNILSNAIKYTKSGGSVRFTFLEKPTDRQGFASFEACVADTGMGMSKEYLKVLFEPFTRENNSTVSGIQGTGLGMAITKNLVEMIGGTIRVESEQGVGTTFTVTFDFEITQATAEKQTEKAEYAFKGERILLAEDNELNREIAVEILTDAGLNVECAEDGKQAVELLKAKGAHYFGLVLMDVQMPVMDGYEATKEIRKLDDKELANIPIIAMTANTFKEDVQAALDAGMNGHIGKPVDVAALLKEISGTVKR